MLVTFNNLWRQATQGKNLHAVLMKSNSFVFVISYTTIKHEWTWWWFFIYMVHATAFALWVFLFIGGSSLWSLLLSIVLRACYTFLPPVYILQLHWIAVVLCKLSLMTFYCQFIYFVLQLTVCGYIPLQLPFVFAPYMVSLVHFLPQLDP